jgi:AAA family ATPase
VVVLAATNRPDSVDLALRRPGRFDREIEVAAPSPPARHGILTAVLSGMAHSLRTDDITAVANSLHGYVAADIAGLCQEAAMSVLRRYADAAHAQTPGWDAVRLEVSAQDVRAAAAVVKPSAMRELAVEVPQVRSPSCSCAMRGDSLSGNLSKVQRPALCKTGS